MSKDCALPYILPASLTSALCVPVDARGQANIRCADASKCQPEIRDWQSSNGRAAMMRWKRFWWAPKRWKRMAGWSKVSAISLICLSSIFSNTALATRISFTCTKWQLQLYFTISTQFFQLTGASSAHCRCKALQSIAKHCKALHFLKNLNDLLPTDAISRGKLQICSWVVILLSRSNQTQLQKKLHFTHILLRVKVQLLKPIYTRPYLGSMHAMEDVDFLVW